MEGTDPLYEDESFHGAFRVLLSPDIDMDNRIEGHSVPRVSKALKVREWFKLETFL